MNAEHVAKLNGSAKSDGAQLGIRPEHVTISIRSRIDNPIKAWVLVTELLGGHLLNGANVNKTGVTEKTDPAYTADMGDICYLGLDTTRCHLFERKSGVLLI